MADLTGIQDFINQMSKRAKDTKISENFDLKDYYLKDSEKNYSNKLVEFIGQLSQQALFGTRPTYQITRNDKEVKNKDEILKYIDKNLFFEAISTFERDALSIDGVCAFAIILGKEKPQLLPINNIITSNYDPFGQLISLTAQFKRTAGTFTYVEMIEWNTKSYRRWYQTEGNDNGNLTLPQLSKLAPEGTHFPKLKAEVKHNLGFVPVKVMFNKPYHPQVMSSRFNDSGRTYDFLGDTYYGAHLLDSIDYIYAQTLKLVHRGSPKVVVQVPFGGKDQNVKISRAQNYDKQEYVMEIEGADDDKFAYTQEQFAGISHLNMLRDSVVSQFLKTCFVQVSGAKKGIVQTNDMEAYQEQRPAVQYFEAKRNQRQRDINDLFEMLVIIQNTYYKNSNYKNISITINILPNEVRDRAKVVDTVIAQLDAGIITVNDAIAQTNNVSQADAEKMKLEIEQDINKKLNQELKLKPAKKENNKE